MISPRLNTEQRRALELLARSRFGIGEEQLVHGHVFGRHVLAELVRAGFAVAERHVMAGARAIEVVRVRITAMGRGRSGGERRAARMVIERSSLPG